MTKRRIILSLAVLLMVGAAAAGYGHFFGNPGTPPLDSHAAISYWELRIKRAGASAAYAEFGRFATPLDASTQHALAHAFGEALYRDDGISGIVICDSRFSYGCYHQLVGDAIAAAGLTVVDSINAQCMQLKNAVPCQHGIGHGLVGYLGYTESSLRKAVDRCGTIDGRSSLQGCYGGVFMEYNMRTLASSSVRTLTRDLLAPCSSYAGYAEESCYLYQPQWWWVSMSDNGTTPTEVFARMSAACSSLTGTPRESCFAGIGEMAPVAVSYDADRSFALCSSASSRPSERALCAEGAAVVFQGTGQSEKALQLCRMLEGAYQAKCLEYASGQRIL